MTVASHLPASKAWLPHSPPLPHPAFSPSSLSLTPTVHQRLSLLLHLTHYCPFHPTRTHFHLRFKKSSRNQTISQHAQTIKIPPKLLHTVIEAMSSRRGGRGGRNPKDLPRDQQVSRKVSWLLRHGAGQEGLKLGEGGYVSVRDAVRFIFRLLILSSVVVRELDLGILFCSYREFYIFRSTFLSLTCPAQHPRSQNSQHHIPGTSRRCFHK